MQMTCACGRRADDVHVMPGVVHEIWQLRQEDAILQLCIKPNMASLLLFVLVLQFYQIKANSNLTSLANLNNMMNSLILPDSLLILNCKGPFVLSNNDTVYVIRRNLMLSEMGCIVTNFTIHT